LVAFFPESPYSEVFIACEAKGIPNELCDCRWISNYIDEIEQMAPKSHDSQMGYQIFQKEKGGGEEGEEKSEEKGEHDLEGGVDPGASPMYEPVNSEPQPNDTDAVTTLSSR
jgi:hypothetical protein